MHTHMYIAAVLHTVCTTARMRGLTTVHDPIHHVLAFYRFLQIAPQARFLFAARRPATSRQTREARLSGSLGGTTKHACSGTADLYEARAASSPRANAFHDFRYACSSSGCTFTERLSMASSTWRTVLGVAPARSRALSTRTRASSRCSRALRISASAGWDLALRELEARQAMSPYTDCDSASQGTCTGSGTVCMAHGRMLSRAVCSCPRSSTRVISVFGNRTEENKRNFS